LPQSIPTLYVEGKINSALPQAAHQLCCRKIFANTCFSIHWLHKEIFSKSIWSSKYSVLHVHLNL